MSDSQNFRPSLAMALALAAFSQLAAANDVTNLPAGALRYGYLMADHWMTLDLTRQIERTLFYSPNEQASANYERLHAAVSTSELRLADARKLYRQLYHTNRADGLQQLNQLLDEIATAESQNEAKALDLLQTIGEKAAPDSFRTLVVPKDTLEPNWEFRRLIGKDYRPSRILFGSTSTPGDDRALPPAV